MKRWSLAAFGISLLSILVLFQSCTSSSTTYDSMEAERTGRPMGLPRDTELWIVGRPSKPSPLVDESLPKGGELRAQLSAERLVPLPLKHTDVRAQISLSIASVEVKQEYHNPYSEKIEAVYVFPLPEDAAVRDFVMTIGDRHIRGIIREREEARRIYLEARRQGYVASLLTEERPNIFTQSVANIEPGKAIDIHIAYFHALKYAKGEYEWIFPMVVGPRYNPPGSRDGVGAVASGQAGISGQRTEVQYLRPSEVTSHDISLEVDLDAGLPIAAIECPSHKVDLERSGETKAKVRLGEGDRIPNRDFVLRYKVARSEVQAALAAFRDESGGYFALIVEPPSDPSDAPPPPREMVFVLDCSGSMSGEPIAKAKAVLKGCLKRLRPCDTFQVIRFSQGASAFGPAPVPATAESVRGALGYVEGLQGEGGTEMIQGIKAALDFPHDEERYRLVAFLTDGYIGNEVEILGEVRKRLGASRLFSFGVGSSVNRYLLEEMARVGRGAVAYVGLNDPDLREVDRFFESVERPAMTDIRIDWGDLQATEVFPDPVPDLFQGRPVILAGRFGAGKGKAAVRISGKAGGAPREMEISIDLAAPGLEHKALPCVWARAKIAQLSSQLATSLEDGGWADQIKQVALRYGLVSDFTAFVAVDSLERTKGERGTTVPVSVPVPQGVRYETTVDER